MGHGEREHALLSASSAEKWLHCPVSARVEEFLSNCNPVDENPAAKEGTLAHEIAELKARKKFNLPESNESGKPMDKQTFTARMNALKEHELYQEEMQRYTDDYIDFLESVWLKYLNMPTVAVEVRVDYSRWAREGFGTSDCIMVGGNTLSVIDFKYGKGVRVSAKDNAQLRLYAAGAYWAYKTTSAWIFLDTTIQATKASAQS